MLFTALHVLFPFVLVIYIEAFPFISPQTRRRGSRSLEIRKPHASTGDDQFFFFIDQVKISRSFSITAIAFFHLLLVSLIIFLQITCLYDQHSRVIYLSLQNK